MRLNIWEALDKYKAHTGADWSSSAITVDKKTNRMVLYYAGGKSLVDAIKSKKLADGSIDVATVLSSYVDDLTMVFSFNNRNGLLMVYRCDGLFEDMPLPFPVHMDRFVEAVAELVGYTEEKIDTPAWRNHIDGLPISSGSDSGVDGRHEPIKVGDKWDTAEAIPSKYNDKSVAKIAGNAFKSSKTFQERNRSRDNIDLDALVPRNLVQAVPPPFRADEEDQLVDALSALAKAEVNLRKNDDKPRIVGLIGLISAMMDKVVR